MSDVTANIEVIETTILLAKGAQERLSDLNTILEGAIDELAKESQRLRESVEAFDRFLTAHPEAKAAVAAATTKGLPNGG